MPNELKFCSGFSTPNLAHPAGYFTPLCTGRLPADLEGNKRFFAGSHVLLKRQEPIQLSQSQLPSPLCADINSFALTFDDAASFGLPLTRSRIEVP
jgi:hypothetical protein